MQLNFLGLVLVAIGIILLGLGITGNYRNFGSSIASGFKAGSLVKSTSTGSSAGSESAQGVSEPSGSAVKQFTPPTNTHTLQA